MHVNECYELSKLSLQVGLRKHGLNIHYPFQDFLLYLVSMVSQELLSFKGFI